MPAARSRLLTRGPYGQTSGRHPLLRLLGVVACLGALAQAVQAQADENLAIEDLAKFYRSVKLRILDQVSSRELTLPLPRFRQRYQHPTKTFSVPIPEGWFVVPAHRNAVADENFDSLTSPDGRQVMIIYRSFMPASGREDLFAYEAAKIREANRFSQARHERFSLQDQAAFRVFYRLASQQEVVSRVALFGPGGIFVINCVHPTSDDDALPTEMREAIQGLRFK